MATGLLKLLDDIATLMKLSSVAAKASAARTAPLVGDDLAVSAEVMMGIDPKRELAIVGKVAQGSAINKVYLTAGLIAMSAAVPVAIPYFLMAGAAFLCYEGYHKTFDKHSHKHDDKHGENADSSLTPAQAAKILEDKKIKQAVNTDIVLSAEILAIALGSTAVAALSIPGQALALAITGVVMTVGVYGAVAVLVKLDDIALAMTQNKDKGLLGKCTRALGGGLLHHALPISMKGLSIAGTAAMFGVGAEMILHNIPYLHHAIEHLVHALPAVPGLAFATTMGINLAAGVAIGFAAATTWKFAGPHVMRGLSALGKALSPITTPIGQAISGVKNAVGNTLNAMNPFKKKSVPSIETPATETPAIAILPVEAAAPQKDLPKPKADLSKAAQTADAAPTAPAASAVSTDAALTTATSTTLNTNRRLS